MSILIDRILKNSFIKKIVSVLGIDKAIFYTVLTIFWTALSGPLSIYFIINYLTITQQGFWYTFLSLGALTTLAELGFTTIVTQFISHEFAHLNEANGKITGENERIDRLLSLIRFSFKFYIIITVIAFLLLTIAGSVFLMHSTNDHLTIIAWIFYSFTGAFLLLVSLLAAVLKGFNKVDTAQKILFFASIANYITIWIALYAGFGLWALGIGGLVNIILSILMFFLSSKSIWSQIIHTKVKNSHNWFKETLPLQWRYAISWSSGYLIFQFMVPITMYYAGAEIAGKLGLSLVLARAVQSVANSWGLTKVPQFNMFVAQKKRGKLDELLRTIQKQSLLIFVISSIVLIFILFFIFPIINWSDRILPIYEILIILIAEGANLIIFNWAYYLRSHKEEPYMRISAISGLLIGFGVWAGMYLFASTSIILIIYCVIAIIMIIPAWFIFVKKSREYQRSYYNQEIEND